MREVVAVFTEPKTCGECILCDRKGWGAENGWCCLCNRNVDITERDYRCELENLEDCIREWSNDGTSA